MCIKGREEQGDVNSVIVPFLLSQALKVLIQIEDHPSCKTFFILLKFTASPLLPSKG